MQYTIPEGMYPSTIAEQLYGSQRWALEIMRLNPDADWTAGSVINVPDPSTIKDLTSQGVKPVIPTDVFNDLLSRGFGGNVPIGNYNPADYGMGGTPKELGKSQLPGAGEMPADFNPEDMSNPLPVPPTGGRLNLPDRGRLGGQTGGLGQPTYLLPSSLYQPGQTIPGQQNLGNLSTNRFLPGVPVSGLGSGLSGLGNMFRNIFGGTGETAQSNKPAGYTSRTIPPPSTAGMTVTPYGTFPGTPKTPTGTAGTTPASTPTVPPQTTEMYQRLDAIEAGLTGMGTLPTEITSFDSMAMYQRLKGPGETQQDMDNFLKQKGYVYDTSTSTWTLGGSTVEDVVMPTLTAEGGTQFSGGFSYRMPDLGSSYLTEYLLYAMGGGQGGGSPSGAGAGGRGNGWYSNVGGTVWNTGR